jgi:uncharacterized membrane protein
MYSTYDLTLLALFDRYPAKYAFADILWGTFALGLSNEIFRIFDSAEAFASKKDTDESDDE